MIVIQSTHFPLSAQQGHLFPAPNRPNSPSLRFVSAKWLLPFFLPINPPNSLSFSGVCCRLVALGFASDSNEALTDYPRLATCLEATSWRCLVPWQLGSLASPLGRCQDCLLRFFQLSRKQRVIFFTGPLEESKERHVRLIRIVVSGNPNGGAADKDQEMRAVFGITLFYGTGVRCLRRKLRYEV